LQEGVEGVAGGFVALTTVGFIEGGLEGYLAGQGRWQMKSEPQEAAGLQQVPLKS